jgi:molybdenum cofactor cytidylyltransferase
MIMLGDMPEVTTDDLDRLIRAFGHAGGRAIVRASAGGKRGNPVILPRAAFADLALAQGDAGARTLMESGKFEVLDVDIGPAAMVDVDTPEALARAGGVLHG